MQCDVVLWSVLQCVAACCGMLHYAALCCTVLHCAAVQFNTLQRDAVRCNVLQSVAACCNLVQRVAVQFLHPIVNHRSASFVCCKRAQYLPPKSPIFLAKQPHLVAEKTGEWKKLENLVQTRSIGSIVGARPTAAPRNGRRDNLEGILIT